MMDPKVVEDRVRKMRKLTLDNSRTLALRVLENPPLFDIETASSCNISCVFCPRDEMKRNTKIMKPEIFEQVCKFLPDDATVMFAGVGEPLVNKYLESYIQLLKKRDISSCIITNGILLTPERQKSIINSGISQIQISYHAQDEKTLDYIMSTSKYKDIVNYHLHYLSENKPEHLRVQLNYVLTEENVSEQEKISEFSKKLGFSLYVRRVHNRGGNHNCLKGSNERVESSCGIYAAVTFISSDGKIMSCSNDVQGTSYFKTVDQTTWKEVVEWKKKILTEGLNFKPCYQCNDDYRWIILDNLSVDARE